MKMKGNKKSFKSLSQTIRSLLGFKNETNSTWDTVCDIIKSLPSTDDYENDNDDFCISQIHGELATLNEEVCRLDAQRRQALNEFLLLKGNIRVFCRIRPIINGENFRQQSPVVPVDSNGILLKFTENKTKLYNFDKILHPSSSQDEVFSEIEPVIKSALDGYNVCILAYGQTGTGKTFTMEGNPDCPGVVPRTIEALFQQAADSNHTYHFSFSMLEIYLGHLKDLLIPQARNTNDPLPPCLSIQTDPNGGIVIDNLVAIQVCNFNHAISLYRVGSQLRSTASTNSNKVSSRSHCMIRLSMTCSDSTERRKITNKIWMVDLGGSERVLKTKAQGRRFEEGRAINLSLSALGDVINALQRKNCHIPYRNSKLTQVLKDSLGEDSKTLMLVHVSPKEEDLCETVCSLNFALRLRSIHLGKTEPNEARVMREAAMSNLQSKMQEIEDNRDRFRKEIKKLNQKLDFLTKTASGSNDKLDSLLSLSMIPAKIDEITVMRPPSKIPRFMKPTICSTQKSGSGNQISYKKAIRPARRKQLPLSRAESVSFPMKTMTESYAGSSISRASCLVGLNEIHSEVDNDTEYSQDVHSILTPVKKSKTKEPIKKGKSGGMKTTNYKYTKVNNKHGQLETADVTSAGQESRFDHNSMILSTGSIQSTMDVDETSTECDIYSRIMSFDMISDTSHHEEYVNGVDGTVISRESTHETEDLEAYELQDNLPQKTSSTDKIILQDLNNQSPQTPGLVHLPQVYSQLYYEKEKKPRTNEDQRCQNNKGFGKRSKRTTFWCGSIQPRSGFSKFLKESIVILYNSVLLGLGFESLGFEHDFFQALMN